MIPSSSSTASQYGIGCQASSPITAITRVTAVSMRAVTLNLAPARRQQAMNRLS